MLTLEIFEARTCNIYFDVHVELLRIITEYDIAIGLTNVLVKGAVT